MKKKIDKNIAIAITVCYAITANGIALTAGKEIDLTSVDALSLSLTISSLESLYKNYGFQINFTLVV